MTYTALALFEMGRANEAAHETEAEARRWIEDERDANPETFLTGQVIEAKPASRIVATYDVKGWH
jgi:hypothetical protein